MDHPIPDVPVTITILVVSAAVVFTATDALVGEREAGTASCAVSRGSDWPHFGHT